MIAHGVGPDVLPKRVKTGRFLEVAVRQPMQAQQMLPNAERRICVALGVVKSLDGHFFAPAILHNVTI